MGFLSSLKGALGLNRPLTPHLPGPVTFSPSAIQHIVRLPKDRAVAFKTIPTDGGRLLTADENAERPPDVPSRTGSVILSSDDKAHLAGLQIDYSDERWRTTVQVQVQPRNTPNPESRLYLTDRLLVHGRPQFYNTLDAAPSLARRLLRHENVQSILIRENTLTVGRREGARWPAIDLLVNTQLREHLLMCGGVLPARDRSHLPNDVNEAIQLFIAEEIAPDLHADGGDIEFIGLHDGVVRVDLLGACKSCPAVTMTLKVGVENRLRAAFPELVDRVEAI